VGPGSTLFDLTFGNAFGTDGSFAGRDLDIQVPLSLTGTVTYHDTVALTGDAPVGDLYRRFDLVLDGGGLATGSAMTFAQDTDNLGTPGDIHPGDGNIPLPSGAHGRD